MEKEWELIRVSNLTIYKLKNVRDSLLRGKEQGKRDLYEDARGRISLEQVIGILIADRERHQARVKRYKKRKEAKKIQCLSL